MVSAQNGQLTPDTLLRIAQGTTNWRVLETFGVKADLDRLPATLHEPAGLPFVEVTIEDLRTGYAALKEDRYALRQWAQILMMCLCFDFAPLEDVPVGDDLLNGLWDLAYGDEPQAEALAAISGVALDSTAKEVATAP